MRTPARRRLLIAIALPIAVCLLSCCVLAWTVIARQDRFGQIVDAANAMQFRTLQSRVSGTFDYRPLRPSSRGNAWGDRDDSAHLRIASRSAQLAATAQSTRDLHRLGISYLLLGKSDAAVATLEKVVQREAVGDDLLLAIRNSRDAALLSDLAAAYLERAAHTQRVSDRVLALDAAQRAWTLQRTEAVAWNRALALEQLHFRDATGEAWTEYLRLDSGSAWSAEARNALALSQRPTLTDCWLEVEPRFDSIAANLNRGELRGIVSRFPQQARMRAEDRLLPQWAKDGSEQTLRALRAIGETLVEQNGEHIVVTIVDTIEQASPQKRRLLMEAYAQYAAAKSLYETNQAAAAIVGLQRASRAFAANDAPVLASLVDVFAAGALFTIERYAQAFDVATSALARLDHAGRYPSLLARLEWIRGLCHLALGRPHQSLWSYGRALEAAERAGEMDFVAALLNLRGEAREAIGDLDGGLESRLEAVRTKSLVGGRNKAEQIMAGGARSLYERGHAEVALALVDVTAANPQFGDRADFAAEVQLLRGMILFKLGRDAEGRDVLASARRYASKSGDAGINAAMSADIDAALALNTSTEEQPQLRVAQLTTALEHARVTANHYHLSRFLLQRSRVLREMGDTAAAEKDLRDGFSEVRLQKTTIPARAMRAIYFASARDLVMDLVELLLQTRRAEEAFDVAEEARAQGLLDPADHKGAREALTHEQIIAVLDERTTLVSNVALPDRLVTWIVSRAGIRTVESPVGRDALEQLLLRHNDQQHESDRAVYDQVVAAADATPMARCVFVQDPVLPPITLAVLRDRRGAYLIEKYPIAYAPSATEYVRSLQAASGAPHASEKPRVFAAAASFFDSDVFEDLSPLRGAEFEVEGVARVHGGVTRVTGRELTTARFLSEAAEAEIVHYAGHAVGGAMNTGAALVMAPNASRGDAGVLYARAITQHQFPRTRLVVLGACGVSDRSEADARAVGSVAYAFLVAGVPAVIATVRPVEDEVTAEFMPRFHAALAQSGNAAVALQATQISFIRGRDPATRDPRTWGAFRLYGHYEK